MLGVLSRRPARRGAGGYNTDAHTRGGLVPEVPLRLLNHANRTAAGLVLALLVLGLINILASRNAGQLATETAAAARTYEIIIDLRGLLARTVDAETGQRGFVITGDERYLEPYTLARASIDAELAELRGAI